MKYLLYLFIALAFAPTAFAQNTEAQKRANVREYCSAAANIAYAAAEGNQIGVPLATHLAIIQPIVESDGIIGEYLEQVIIDAYARPRYSLPDYQQSEIAEYRDQTHASCLKLLL